MSWKRGAIYSLAPLAYCFPFRTLCTHTPVVMREFSTMPRPFRASRLSRTSRASTAACGLTAVMRHFWLFSQVTTQVDSSISDWRVNVLVRGYSERHVLPFDGVNVSVVGGRLLRIAC